MSEYTWPSPNTVVSREELRSSLDRYSREPFADVLEALLQARPRLSRLMAWANESPDKWANALKVMALLSGYTEKTETIHQHVHLHKMSDAQLIQATQEMISADPTLLRELKQIHEAQTVIETSTINEIPSNAVQILNKSIDDVDS